MSFIEHIVKALLSAKASFPTGPGSQSKSPVYGADENDPNIAIRYNVDGTETYGAFSSTGDFIPSAVQPVADPSKVVPLHCRAPTR